MKKSLSILLTAALTLSLAACTASDPQPSPVREPAAVEEQIGVIAANRDLWLAEESAYTPYYAVTDLDGNGCLELIRSVPGDDWWCTDTFYTLSEDGTALRELPFPFGEEHSHPDLADEDRFRLYTGPEGRFLIAKDNIFMGPVQASDYRAFHVLDYLRIAEDGVEAGDLAWCLMQDEDTNGDGLSENHIYYYTGSERDEEIDGEAYVNAPAERFAGCSEEVCTIAWWTLGEETQASEEALKDGLFYSWQGFSVEADDAVFDSLVEDPYFGFYAAGAGGAPIYRMGDEVPYFPSYREIKGTWYLQCAWTDADVSYVGKGLAAGELNILDSGQLYMNYSNENDPRGAYLLTEMNMTRDSRAEGAGADDWVIVYESAGGEWQLQLRPDPDRDMLYVTWYEWPDGDRSAEPTGVNLEYSRIAG